MSQSVVVDHLQSVESPDDPFRSGRLDLLLPVHVVADRHQRVDLLLRTSI